MDDLISRQAAIAALNHNAELSKKVVEQKGETMSEPKIKLCPFCGREPTYWHWNYGFMIECHQNDHRIQCEAKTKEEAIEAWNRRDGEPHDD